MIDASPHETWEAARAVGVTRMVTIGVDLPSSADAIEIARGLPGVFATVGVHPNESTGYDDAAEAALDRLAGAPQVVGIGEAGLDRYRKGASLEDQERSFRSQIRLAKRRGIALVVHTRDAHPDTKRVLADEGPPERLVMHCFSGDERDAADYLDLGAVLSFAGNVTYKNARTSRRRRRRARSTACCSRPTLRSSRRTRSAGSPTHPPGSPSSGPSWPRSRGSPSETWRPRWRPPRTRCGLDGPATAADTLASLRSGDPSVPGGGS